MNSAPVEGAERIRAEADPYRGPRPELFEGDTQCLGRSLPLCVRTEQSKEGTMKTIIATATTLIATPVLADPGHFAVSHGHSHWVAAGALALAAMIGAVAIWKTRLMNRAAKKVLERKA